MKKVVVSIILFLVLILGVNHKVKATTYVDSKIDVRYRVAVTNLGWQDNAYYNGDTAGNEDGVEFLQSMRLVLINKPEQNMGIQYQTYVKNKGWQSIEANGGSKELTGQPITATKISLINSTKKYSVKYRVCLKNKEWQQWCQDGNIAGAENGDEIIALQIKIVEDKDYITPKIQVRYRTHTLNGEWSKNAYNDEQAAGTINSNTFLDSFRMVLQYAPNEAGVEYKTYVATKGWQNWKESGHESNSYNSAITGIKIKLLNMDNYVICYRVCVENKGWQPWTENGKLAGSEGENKIEAIEVKIIEKSKFVKEKSPNSLKVRYRTHTVNSDWSKDAYYDGQTGGEENSKKYLDVVRMVLQNNPDNIGIEYATYTKGRGWSGWKENGHESNDYGYKITGIRIRLTNTIDYSVKYRVYLENKGWTSWQKDSYFAGTEGKDNIEAIQIKIEDREDFEVNVRYRVNIQNIGWQEAPIYNGELAGNGENTLKSIRMVLQNAPSNVGIKYRAFNENTGWDKWASNGGESGNAYSNLQAFRIELTNTTDYSVKYRAYVKNKGWTQWVFDGKIVGEPGNNTNIVGIEVAVLKEKHILNVEAKQTIANGKYKISPQSNLSKYLNAGENKNGGNINLSNIDYTRNQYFIITYLGNGYYKIVAESSNKNVGINGSGTSNYVDVCQYDDSIYINKEWIIANVGNGYYYIVSDCNYLCLDASDEGRLKVTKQNYGPSQLFKLEKIVIDVESGTYGPSGLKIKGDNRGTDLKYYKIGNGPNVYFATFAVHGWEDDFNFDGQELTKIAEEFKNKLISMQDEPLAKKWTIYILPSVNPDGEYYGNSHNGPGRTTLFSAAPANRNNEEHKGIDINRCWSTDYTRYSGNRNYNGTEPFQAHEARALRDFLLARRATNGQTVLVDLHGWLNETIGDYDIGGYYRSQLGISKHIYTYGRGYLVNWARANLGTNGRVARSCLVELPQAWSSYQVSQMALANKYINATINMLRNI